MMNQPTENKSKNELLKLIYKIYFEDTYYTQSIFVDKDFQESAKDIERYEKKIKNILKQKIDEEECNKLLNQYSALYLNECNIYRTYDFMQGLTTGIAVGLLIDTQHNDKFIKELMKIIENNIEMGN